MAQNDVEVAVQRGWTGSPRPKPEEVGGRGGGNAMVYATTGLVHTGLVGSFDARPGAPATGDVACWYGAKGPELASWAVSAPLRGHFWTDSLPPPLHLIIWGEIQF